MGSRTRLAVAVPLIQQRKEPSMAVKILVAPRQDDSILDIARSLTPPGFELVVAEVGTPQFYEVAPEVEYYLGIARQMGGEFFRSTPKLRLVQLLSAGYDRVDIEAARKSGVPVATNGGANAIAVRALGKTLGIVGLGYIGKKVARRAAAFDMSVQYYDIA
jgi:phosphoglycerate dehydrogenase-like enzyme